MPFPLICLVKYTLSDFENFHSNFIAHNFDFVDIFFKITVRRLFTETTMSIDVKTPNGFKAYSKVPIIRTGTYASSAVHTMYCQNCPMFGTYNRSFRVSSSSTALDPIKKASNQFAGDKCCIHNNCLITA